MHPALAHAVKVLKGVQAARVVTLQTILASALYAAQSCLSVFIILHTYHVMRIANPLWALVSAVLIIQPGLNQSLSNALTRVVANGAGMFAGWPHRRSMATDI